MLTAYLLGSQGTPKQAILLDLVTTIAHTASIFALGLLALRSFSIYSPRKNVSRSQFFQRFYYLW